MIRFPRSHLRSHIQSSSEDEKVFQNYKDTTTSRLLLSSRFRQRMIVFLDHNTSLTTITRQNNIKIGFKIGFLASLSVLFILLGYSVPTL
jgi:hypothetical protein